MPADKLCKEQNKKYFGKLGRLEPDTGQYQPSLRIVCRITHQNNQRKQHKIKHVHQPIEVQQYGIIKQGNHQHKKYAESQSRNLLALKALIHAAYGKNPDDGQRNHHQHEFKVKVTYFILSEHFTYLLNLTVN